jgi:uncharacterized protein YcfL
MKKPLILIVLALVAVGCSTHDAEITPPAWTEADQTGGR